MYNFFVEVLESENGKKKRKNPVPSPVVTVEEVVK